MASVTAWANDYDFDDYIQREIETYGKKANDILIILSTSGGNFQKKQSINLINLAIKAKRKKILIISLLGKGGGELCKLSNLSLIVNSDVTSTVQETHKIILHSICNYIDSKIS